jgi:hypothetical protein
VKVIDNRQEPDMAAHIVRELGETLTHKTRMISEPQLLTTYGCTRRDLAAVLHRDPARRLIDRLPVLAAPLLVLERPLHVWEPGRPEPNCQAVSYLAQTRWSGAVRPTWAYFATREAADVFGGRGGLIKNPLQATHDLHVTQCFLRLRKTSPQEAQQWIGEDAIASPELRRWSRLPDALLFDSTRGPLRAIEFIGQYSPSRICSFHRFCAERQLPYEMW